MQFHYKAPQHNDFLLLIVTEDAFRWKVNDNFRYEITNIGILDTIWCILYYISITVDDNIQFSTGTSMIYALLPFHFLLYDVILNIVIINEWDITHLLVYSIQEVIVICINTVFKGYIILYFIYSSSTWKWKF